MNTDLNSFMLVPKGILKGKKRFDPSYGILDLQVMNLNWPTVYMQIAYRFVTVLNVDKPHFLNQLSKTIIILSFKK